jgi:hypothetical protein
MFNKLMKKKGVGGKLFLIFALALFVMQIGYSGVYAATGVNVEGYMIGGLGGTTNVYNQLGIGGTLLPVNCVVQFIKANGSIHAPNPDGSPSGGDALLTQEAVGAGGTGSDGTFDINKSVAGPSGTLVYFRAWNSSNIASATYYGDSSTHATSTASDPPPPAPEYWEVPSFYTNVAFILSPAISNVSPIGATAAGTTITITGSNFGATQGTGKVRFKQLFGAGTSTEAATYTSWGASQVVVTNPALTNGTYEVTVTASNDTTGTWQTFYYGVPGITAAISGSPADRGATGKTITGINFGVTTGTVHFGSLTATVGTWNNTTITFTVPNNAQTGSNNVYVTNSSALDSNTVSFTVNSTMSIVCAPNSAYKGDNVSVGITGTNTYFVPSTTVSFGSNTTTTTTYVSATSLTCLVTIDASAGQGLRTVTVTTNNPYTEIITQGSAFTVNAPSFTSVTPASGAQGATLTGVAIVGTGTHFQNGVTTVAFSGTGVTGEVTNVASQTSATISVYIQPTAAITARNVVVTTGSETVTGTNEFTVTAASTGGQLIYEKAGGIMMAYPNPFNPNDKANPLKMLFNTATGEAVDIYIFDTNARIIYQRRNADPLSADRTVTWDGETSYGEVVENGLYLIRIVEDGKLVAKGKILVIKK